MCEQCFSNMLLCICYSVALDMTVLVSDFFTYMTLADCMPFGFITLSLL